jgi:hypothetical protein
VSVHDGGEGVVKQRSPCHVSQEAEKIGEYKKKPEQDITLKTHS